MHIPTFAQSLVPLTAPYLLTTPSINDGPFQNAVLNTHNADRAKHGVPALAWDPKLAEFAQKWANNCEFKHSGGPHGENLYGSWSTSPSFNHIQQTTSAIHSGWYAEISKYDFNKPGFSASTGHFTQLVWKSTRKVGCAWNTVSCKSNGMYFYKLVCEYDPRGNIVGEGGKWFKENVLRPIKKADADVSEMEEVEDVEAEEGGFAAGGEQIVMDGQEVQGVVVEL